MATSPSKLAFVYISGKKLFQYLYFDDIIDVKMKKNVYYAEYISYTK